MKSIVFLGPPGAGKGTVASKLREMCGFLPLSTGDLLRNAVKEGTELGLKARDYMERGELVPDTIILNIVKEFIFSNKEAPGFIFDGFPRTVAQALQLEQLLKPDYVFLLDASDKTVLERLGGRRVCRQCGAIYHMSYHPPKVDGRCDICGGELYQREDDKEETIRKRLEVYRKYTAPLIEFYDKKGLLIRIDANVSADENSLKIAGIVGCEMKT